MSKRVGPPKGARFEADLGDGFALWDVSHLLPRHRWKRYKKRDPGKVVRLYCHHSGAYGRDGYSGLLNSTRYVTRARGFAGCAYTFWLPRRPDVDSMGRSVIYRGVAPADVSWHSGRAANHHGDSLCFQGNLRRTTPTSAQYDGAEVFCDWWKRQAPRAVDRAISMHNEASDFGGRSKFVCPGPHVTAWVKSYRSES